MGEMSLVNRLIHFFICRFIFTSIDLVINRKMLKFELEIYRMFQRKLDLIENFEDHVNLITRGLILIRKSYPILHHLAWVVERYTSIHFKLGVFHNENCRRLNRKTLPSCEGLVLYRRPALFVALWCWRYGGKRTF